MKKLFTMLLAIPFIAMLAACSDDKDLPSVNVSVDYSGATAVEDGIQIAQGQTLNIDAIKFTPVSGSKQVSVTNTTYLLDGVSFYSTGIAPFSGSIITDDIPVGVHTLSFMAEVYQVDKEPGMAIFGFKLIVTEPGSADEGSGTVIPDVRMGSH